MPEDQPRKRSQGEPEPNVGDAGFLFRDAPAAGKSSPLRESAAGAGPGTNEVFDLVDVPEPAAEPDPASPPHRSSPVPGERVPRLKPASVGTKSILQSLKMIRIWIRRTSFKRLGPASPNGA